MAGLVIFIKVDVNSNFHNEIIIFNHTILILSVFSFLVYNLQRYLKYSSKLKALVSFRHIKSISSRQFYSCLQQ